MSTTTHTSTEDRALSLLSSNVEPRVVASALGITESAISQLLSREEFAEKVALRKYEVLANHSLRDNKYDDIEDDVLEKLKHSLAMIFEPMKLLKVLQVVNTAKRRGMAAPEAAINKQPTLTLNVPTILLTHFSTQNNIYNQVLEVNDPSNPNKSLVTIQSSALDALRSNRGDREQKLIPAVSESSQERAGESGSREAFA